MSDVAYLIFEFAFAAHAAINIIVLFNLRKRFPNLYERWGGANTLFSVSRRHEFWGFMLKRNYVNPKMQFDIYDTFFVSFWVMISSFAYLLFTLR